MHVHNESFRPNQMHYVKWCEDVSENEQVKAFGILSVMGKLVFKVEKNCFLTFNGLGP